MYNPLIKACIKVPEIKTSQELAMNCNPLL